MAKNGRKTAEAVAAGQRLTLLWVALGYERRRDFAKDLARRMDISWETLEKRLEKYEDGNTLLPVALARILNDLHGTTYEWWWDNDSNRLPYDLHKKIDAARRRVS